MNIWHWAWLIGLSCCLFTVCCSIIIDRLPVYIVSLLLFPPLLVSIIYWSPAFLSGNTYEYKTWAYVFISLWVLHGYIGTFIGWIIHIGFKGTWVRMKRKRQNK
jgi:hypothetical protein